MPMQWRRRSKKSYKTISSSDESDAATPPPVSIRSSRQPQPRPQQRQAVPTLIWKRRTKRTYKTVSSSSSADYDEASDSSLSTGPSPIIISQPEDNQDQPVHDPIAASSQKIISKPETNHQDQPLPDYDSGACSYDADLELRERSRRNGNNRPVLRWENMSREYYRWFKQMEVHNTEPVIENQEICEPSADVILPLLRYQKEWLRWALDQEASETKGGILADEMGMGKTIQAISLVLTSRGLHAKSEASSSSSKDNNKCTLVICPLTALLQWQREIEMHTADGCLKILLFYGKDRLRGELDFSQYDFVITGHKTVESDYRKYVLPPKEKCEYCDRGFTSVRTLITHQRDFCGPDATKTGKQAKPKKKAKEKVEQMELTTPQTSPLHSVRWERIIIDEAHSNIKSRASNTAKSVFALESEYKWALSGTPLQNNVGELYSLIRFLQIVPYSYFFCKDCDCRVLDYSSSYTCDDCGHSSSRHFCWWNKYISRPMQNRSAGKPAQRAMLLLREKVLKSTLLRRTKEGRLADFAYPPKYVKLRCDSMDETEHDFYEAMHTQSCIKFNSYVEAGTVMNNYAHIFQMLTRLRQAVDHPYLVLYPPAGEICGLCQSEAQDSLVTSCNHAFCKSCWDEHASMFTRLPACPTCLTVLTVGPRKKTRKQSKNEEINMMIAKDGTAKGIVFSQFTAFIDLIGYSLQTYGVKYARLDGRMNIAERDNAIATFTADDNCIILLMSLKSGGVALNLTVASHVFLMDPWWNPAVEKQAQDRIHRIGQYKPIRVVRFVIENTVEERILTLQEKKALVFEGTVGNSADAMQKLTAQDLQLLFAT
ncbi:hypothetical protein LUZ62_052473 [Rhynchospora pubera]|uniref:DNA repair protein RAD16 n=1 Tax=Rhynchospora pubera TaxID=906938 RepID=A0AAV8GFE5_9POAL|nr:hypothetical protein LUZ62_052473 [Rhynchospora pubera]